MWMEAPPFVRDISGTDVGECEEPGGESASSSSITAPMVKFEFGTTFILQDSQQSLVTQGIKQVFNVASSEELLSQRVQQIFESLSDHSSIVVGALPFDRKSVPCLFEPVAIQRESFADLIRDTRETEFLSWTASYPEPSRQEYADGVRSVLECFREDPELTKVVLARSLVFNTGQRLNPLPILHRLREDENATVFCAPLWDQKSILIGASPELLLEKKGAIIRSHPLAGSAARMADPEADRLAGEQLLQSEKDLREHAAVVQSIADRLAPYCRSIRIPQSPSLVSTATMWHLGTEIEGELKDESVSSIELAAAIYPTPAVCGTPRDGAKAVIDELEPFDRGFFAGAVGWCDSRGDGRWMVSIRCAEISEHQIRLYAGAGIVAGSDPESEAEETAQKFRTLLDALRFEEKQEDPSRMNL